MLHNDISNRMGVTFGFRCDGFLLVTKNDSILDKAVKFVAGDKARLIISEDVRQAMSHIYRNTEYTVDLVVNKAFYTTRIKKMLEDVPHNRVVLIETESQITSRLMVGDLSYYVDGNEDRRSRVNSREAISLSQASEYIRNAMRGN